MSTHKIRPSDYPFAGTPTATPRTDAAAARQMRDKCAKLETELARACAEVERLTFLCKCESESSVEMHARAERAEADLAKADLAKERARLDYLSTRGFEHRHHETGDHLGYEWTISIYSESEDVTLRDVIDAEMREEAK